MNDFTLETLNQNEPQPTRTDMILHTGDKAILNWTTAQGIEQMERAAKILAAAEFVPKHYQNKPANCMIAIDIAMRMNLAISEVVQNMSPIYGKPTFAAKWQVARLNKSGAIKGRIRYEFGGAKREERWCVAHATTADGEEVRSTKISWAMAEAEGWTSRKDRSGYETSKWPTMTDTMLGYRAATFLISQHFPEVTMGMPDSESVLDAGPRDITAEGSHVNIIDTPKADGGAAPPLKTGREPEKAPEQSEGTEETMPGETTPQETVKPKNWDNPNLDCDDIAFDRAAHATKGGIPRKDEDGRFVPIRKRQKKTETAPKEGAPNTNVTETTSGKPPQNPSNPRQPVTIEQTATPIETAQKMDPGRERFAETDTGDWEGDLEGVEFD